ncbi:hypothetical protein KY314_04625 [Candidatus Woesearchaeota archaeon]|nr:hypothetical protein [Candidatus Woesearchaeota archaeon]
MGQIEILSVLKKAKRPLARSEILKELNDQNPSKISHTLQRLMKYREVECIELDFEQTRKLTGTKCPRRTRFYYLYGKKYYNFCRRR